MVRETERYWAHWHRLSLSESGSSCSGPAPGPAVSTAPPHHHPPLTPPQLLWPLSTALNSLSGAAGSVLLRWDRVEGMWGSEAANIPRPQ